MLPTKNNRGEYEEKTFPKIRQTDKIIIKYDRTGNYYYFNVDE